MSNQHPPTLLHTDTLGTGPHLVILHGLFGSGENWRNQAKMLSANFTVHSMDARNHGESPHTDAISYPAMAADVIATCQHLKLDRIHLLGHSMGGKTAMQIAITHPKLIDRLIIVDIGPRQYPHHHNSILEGLRLLQQHPPASRKQADEAITPYVDDAGVRAFLLKNLRRTSEGSYALRVNVDVIHQCYDYISAAITATQEQTGFCGPTLFIKGVESDYLKDSDRELVLNLFPNAQLKAIDGAGHWPHSEKPEVVFKIIADFLN